MKWVCSPEFYGPLTIWPWLRISPQSSLKVIYYLIISAWQWLMRFTYIRPVFLCKLNPRKACPGKGQAGPFFHWKSSLVIPFPPQDFCMNLSHLIHNTADTSGLVSPSNWGLWWVCEWVGNSGLMWGKLFHDSHDVKQAQKVKYIIYLK